MIYESEKKTFRRGFTLIEIIVVMTIIGILATITIVSYTGIQTRANDVSIQSDIDRMEALQTNYALKNNVDGKAYFLGNGVDPELNFSPSDGNVISVVVNSADYCIRGYNPNSSKNSIDNAYSKESSDGACGSMVVVVEETIELGFVAVAMVAMTRHATVNPERLTPVVAVAVDTKLTTVALAVLEL